MKSANRRSRANVEQAVPLFGVRDIQASLRFYVDGLGFTMTKKWEPEGKLRWCWLELGNVAVMLQEFWNEDLHRHVPKTKVGVGVSMNFICRDALAIYREITARGIEANRPVVGNAMWETSVRDPDGYNLHFESPTDVPEDTVYSDPAH